MSTPKVNSWLGCWNFTVNTWLPHFPMLAFDILPSYGGGIGILPWLFISFMHNPSFVFGYGG
jgi:hypothetical protein